MEILEKYKAYLHRNYAKRNTFKSYYGLARRFLSWLENETRKDLAQLTKDDALEYRDYCLSRYTQNGNVVRMCAFNLFVAFLGRPELKVPTPSYQYVNKQVLGNDEIERYISASAELSPLHHLIAIYQVDGLLRPSEFGALKISQHDIQNQILYLDDTKTGNGSVILSPRMIEAFQRYMWYRTAPKQESDGDTLIIAQDRKWAGVAPIHMAKFIHYKTSQIAAHAGFTKHVYPYLIKPSAITAMFNRQVNPRITQRQARHKRIETTLRYDHTNDEMAKQHFNKEQSRIDVERLSPGDKARVLLDKFLDGKIDKTMFSEGLDILLPSRKHGGDDIAFR